jgi:hypothetical protein
MLSTQLVIYRLWVALDSDIEALAAGRVSNYRLYPVRCVNLVSRDAMTLYQEYTSDTFSSSYQRTW